MALNKSTGNMYDFITHTWNPIRGTCSHQCKYCYMHSIWDRFPEMRDLQFVEKEMGTNLGVNKYIFIGSSTDIWCTNIPLEWIKRVFNHCMLWPENRYFVQTKNPARFVEFANSLDIGDRYLFFEKFSFCVTIESNRENNYMGDTVSPQERAWIIKENPFLHNQYVTVEPIMDFGFPSFHYLLAHTQARQINIGADSGKNNLPEPSKEKLLRLIDSLGKFTKVKQKDNLKRLLNET